MTHDVELEKLVLDYLRARRGEEVPKWDVIKELQSVLVPVLGNLDATKRILEVIGRLKKEKKIIWKKRRRTYRISEVFY